MKNLKAWHFLVAFALIGAWPGVSAMAQSKKVEPIASLNLKSSGVNWEPHIDHARIILTVSRPDGEVFRDEFEAGTTPSFKLIDKNGVVLPDGHYKYELRLVPKLAGGVTETLAAARADGRDAETAQELQRVGLLPTRPIVQSGSFLVRDGSIVTDGAEEPKKNSGRTGGKGQGAIETQSSKKGDGGEGGDGPIVPFDQVIADDLIVQGSACVGLDCVNNENFGFDTIRMKENNTRIKFEDTSTSAGFPSTDWQLTANDSASGGLNKFSVEDITGATVPFTIEGGTPTNSLYLDSTGRIGLRTSTPVLDLHAATGNTPAFRLEQNASGGFTAQTWDIAGNEANFFIRDVTGGSRLPFRIQPGAPTSSIHILASGNVGFGTSSPAFKIDVVGNSRYSGSNVQFSLTGSKVGGNEWLVQTVDADGRFRIFDNTGSAERITVLQTSGNVGIGTATPLGKLDVNGTIFQRGIQIHADYVFEPDYTLESIEDHAAFMWNNKHLPALGARKVDQQGREVVEIGAQMRGMLEELEKAHIYISSLNEKVVEKDVQLAKLAQQNQQLAERLARIEAVLSSSKGSGK